MASATQPAATQPAGTEVGTDHVELSLDEPDDIRDTFVSALAGRVDYQLHYQRSPKKRTFNGSGITGPAIDDAYTPGRQSPGEWNDDTLTCATLTEQGVLAQFFDMAISEAVHEALEWFRIDGRPALDPHGAHEHDILHIVSDAARQLWELRNDHPAYALVHPAPQAGGWHIRDVGPEGVDPGAAASAGTTLCGLGLAEHNLRDDTATVTCDTIDTLEAETDADDRVCATCADTWRSQQPAA